LYGKISIDFINLSKGSYTQVLAPKNLKVIQYSPEHCEHVSFSLLGGFHGILLSVVSGAKAARTLFCCSLAPFEILSLLPMPLSRLSVYLYANTPAGPNYHSKEILHFSFQEY
jgi:hypothetical protein